MLNEFSNVKQLKDESRFKEALQIINELEKSHNFSTEEKFEFYLLKHSLLYELGYLNEAFSFLDLADEERPHIKDKLRIFDFLLFKIRFLFIQEKNDELIKILTKAEQILETISNLSLVEFKERYASLLLIKGRYYMKIGDYDLCNEYTQEALKIAKEIKNDIIKIQAVKLLSFNYSFKGDHNKALEIGKKYLKLAKKANNKQEVIGALNHLGMTLTEKEEYNQALEYLEQGLSICDEISSFKTTAVLTSLFDLYLKTNNLERAQQCLDRIKLIKNQINLRWFEDAYRLGEAEILKKKSQWTSQIKAREIFKQIVDEEDTFPEFNYVALMQLCDSYLIELANTNDLRILEELQPYLTRLMDLAIGQQSYWLLVEGYSFQAKLKLITFEFGEAEKFLDQALFTAEKYGQDRMGKHIMKEQAELSRNLIKWERLKNTGATISDRMDLARIDEQIELLLQKRRYIKSIKIAHG
ncbi:MAG: tetratricopeptide repeat protein [Candidatus Hermodarchaeota archaeon]